MFHFVERMWLTLLRECEGSGSFRRYANGSCAGGCLIINYTNLSFLVIMGVYGGIRACGKYRDRCGDLWRDRDVVFVFYLL